MTSPVSSNYLYYPPVDFIFVSSLKLKIPKGQPEAVNRRRTDNKWSKEKGVIDCCLMPTQFSNFPAISAVKGSKE
jgi:hypothetical protein